MNKILSLFMALCGLLSLAACNEEEIQKKVDAEIMHPYFELLKSGHYEDAYNKYTSSTYKEFVSFQEYAQSHQRLVAKFGPLEGFQSVFFKPIYGLNGKVNEVGYEVGLKYKNTETSVCVIYVLRPSQDANYMIDSGWHNKRLCVRASDGSEDGPF